MIDTILAGVALLIYTTYTAKSVLHAGHIFQLNSYRPVRFLKWLHEDFIRRINLLSLIPLITFVFYADSVIFLSCWAIIYLFLLLTYPKQTIKKKLVITGRVKRLFSAMAGLWLGIFLVLYQFNYENQTVHQLFFPFLGLTVSLILLPYLLVVAHYLTWPIERSIARFYVRGARKIMKNSSELMVIGITGSYGKTSTKFILNELLATQYHTLMTPESFNTLLGVTRVIREQLRPTHEIFIVEMGAKQKGDIQEICELVEPDWGLITTIGEQHLEMFKTIDNIKYTKAELITSLPQNGIAFLNLDNEHFPFLERCTHAKVVKFGMDNLTADYRVNEIKQQNDGITRFTILTPQGDSIELETRLLGKHNLQNLLAAVSVANELKIPVRDIKRVVKMLKPAPHRLNVRTTSTGITIIDNAFSSNPVGAKMALEVLARFTGRRVLITPGMVELGAVEYQENKTFGEYAATRCDYIILVGAKQTKAILDGLKYCGYPDERLYIAQDLNDANAHFKQMAQAGDIVLYENDLPDTYN